MKVLILLILAYLVYRYYFKKEHYYPTMRDKLNYFKAQEPAYSESAAFGLRAVGWGAQ